MMGAGVKMKKVILTAKRCYRSICNHLLLVFSLFFFVFLYRSFPLIFFMLVSASPVLVCTFIVLGALLSVGKPNIPSIELDKCETHDVVILKTGFSDDILDERNESESVEKCNYRGKGMEEKLTERTSEIVNDISKLGLDDSSGKKVEKISRNKELDDRVQEEGKKRFQGFKLKNKRKVLEERHVDRRIEENQYSLITAYDTDDEGHFGQENNESLVDSVDSTEVNVDSLDSFPGSPWKHVDKEEGYEDDVEGLDSGSGGAESSSPEASIADISPVLDELHPLLEENTSQPANLSRDVSDASSELSVISSGSSSDLDDDTDDHEELMVGEDDNEGGDDEEVNEDKEDQTKSAITWTEEDQKNLIDLGTSELERNQRLENLIEKRRARRCMTMVTERNLIDLDSTDPPIHVNLVLTTRTNPFDPPQDSYENMGLPPIPGSAPSLPWKNPFDIPFDLSNEKLDLMEDSFKQEFIPTQSKDTFLCRHESFNVHPSSFEMNRTEKQFVNKFRPYFVSEQLGSEGTSYSAINRQPSEASGSKASSVPDTESVSSTGDMEEQDDTEEDSSYIDAEDDIAREPDLISKMDGASELVGHGSESSEDEDYLELGQVDKSHIKFDEIDMKFEDADNHQETESNIKAERSIVNQLKIGSSGIHQNTEAPLTDDTAHKEPVYDSSPSSALENLSPCPVSPDPQGDSGVDLSSIKIKKTVSFSNKVTIADKLNGSASKVKEYLIDEELEPLEKNVHGAYHKNYDGAFEPSAAAKEYVGDVINIERVPVSAAVSHARVANEQSSAADISNEVDSFMDVGSDSDESDRMATMHDAWEDTAFEVKAAVRGHFGLPDINNVKKRSGNKSSSSNSSSSFSCGWGSGSYASLNESNSD